MFYQAPSTATIATSTSGDNTIVAAVTGRKIRVLGYVLSANAAVNTKWRSASTDKTGLRYFGSAGQESIAPLSDDPEVFWFETAAGEALVLNLSGAVAVGGYVVYIVV